MLSLRDLKCANYHKKPSKDKTHAAEGRNKVKPVDAFETQQSFQGMKIK